MRLAYLILVALLTLGACKSKKPERTIALNVMFIEEYCGGAEPMESLIEDMETPKPYNGTIYLHLDTDPQRLDKGITVEISQGKGTLVGISQGCLLGFITPKYDLSSDDYTPQQIDCYRNIPPTVEFSWTIYEDTKDLEAMVIKRCDPCLMPMP